MSFTFTNYAGIKPQESAFADIIGKILSGYTDTTQAQYLRPTLEEQLQKSRLENKWYEPNMQSQIGLRGAQAGNLGAMTEEENIKNKYLPRKLESELASAEFNAQNPLLSSTGTAGQLGALLYLQQHPELGQQQEQSAQENGDTNQDFSSAPSIKAAQQQTGIQQNNLSSANPRDIMLQSILNSLKPKQKEYAPSNLGKLQQEYADIQAGYYPNSNRSIPFESEQVKEDVASPYRERLGGLKTGEHFVYDPETHEKIGVQRPYTAKERETQTGRAFFNEIFPTINTGFKDFIGKGSIDNFRKYATDYGKNEVATRKIDDLLLAQKLISAGIVNEAATLGAGKTNMTYRNLAKSFPNSDLPGLIEAYGKQLILPGDAFMKAGVRFNQMINQAQERAVGSVPALKTQYYNPEKHVPKEEEKSSNIEKIAHYTDSDIRATAQKYGISEAEVKKRLKKAKKNG